MYQIMGRFWKRYVFHFTDSRNVGNIINQGGILSLKELKRRGLDNVYWGGNNISHRLDRNNGMDDYVHLCFITNHPMEYTALNDGRIKETKWIYISREVLKIDGVLFTNDIANGSGVEKLTNEQAVEQLDHEAIFDFVDFRIDGNRERKVAAERYEILVPKIVPLSLIGNING